eukprot:5872538-Prymnesium_polylepis.1
MGDVRSCCIARARTARDVKEWVTRVRHTQHAQHCTDPLCDNSHYGLGRAEQRTGSGDHLRHVVVDVLKS